MKPIYISITDDHPMVISGLITLLQPYQHIRVQGTYSTAASLLEGLKYHQPDVLLLDILLPDQSGKELAPQLLKLYPRMKLLILTSLDVPAMVVTLLRKGCKGYLLKGIETETLVEAIETVHNGGEYIDEALKEQLLQNALQFKTNTQGKTVLPELTQREKEVLLLIAEEYTTREIAEKLFISYHTAENHRNNLIQKLDVKNTVGLVRVAIQLGLVK